MAGFDAKKIGEQIEKAAYKATVDDLKKKSAAVVCPVHRKRPTLTITGTTLKTLKWSVSCCCEAASEAAKAQMGG